MINGYIPEKILYVCKKSEPITPKFSDTDEEFFSTSAMPAFPVDVNKENTVETARKWAKGYSYGRNDNEVHKEVEMVNEPIYEVQIVDLEIRGEGGRAYKAIVHGSFLVDIREDVILEAMLEKGIRQGSFISCSFIWAKIGSHMKLIRNGSSLHKAAKAAHALKQQKKVSTKDLKPGHVYQNINSYFMFLGFVKSARVNSEYVHASSRMFRRNDEGKYVVTGRSKIEKQQLWLNFSRLLDTDILDINSIFTRVQESGYSLELSKSKTVYPCDDITPLELPDDIIEQVKVRKLEYVNAKVDEYSNQLITNMAFAIMSKYPESPIFNGVVKDIWEEAVTK